MFCQTINQLDDKPCYPFPLHCLPTGPSRPSLDAKACLPALVPTSPVPSLAEKPNCYEATRQRPASVFAREKSRRWGERLFLSSFRHQVHPAARGSRRQEPGRWEMTRLSWQWLISAISEVRGEEPHPNRMPFYASGAYLKSMSVLY